MLGTLKQITLNSLKLEIDMVREPTNQGHKRNAQTSISSEKSVCLFCSLLDFLSMSRT